jgi:hypothetical protein
VSVRDHRSRFVSGTTASSEKAKDHRQQSTQKNKEHEDKNDTVHRALVHLDELPDHNSDIGATLGFKNLSQGSATRCHFLHPPAPTKNLRFMLI